MPMFPYTLSLEEMLSVLLFALLGAEVLGTGDGVAPNTPGMVPPVQSSVTVKTSRCDANATCMCEVDLPSGCSLDDEYQQLVRAQTRLDYISGLLKIDAVDRIKSSVDSVHTRMRSLEGSLSRQSVSVSLKEFAVLREHVTMIESSVRHLSNHSVSINITSVTQHVEEELNKIRAMLQLVSSRNPLATREEMEKECESKKVVVTQERERRQSFLGDEIPYDTPITADRCRSIPNITIGEPITFKFRAGLSGLWLRDPLPRSSLEARRIYEMNSYQEANKVFYYEDLSTYQSSISESKKLSSPCTFYHQGSKPLIHNGALIWFNYHTASGLRKADLFGEKTCHATLKTSPIAIVAKGYLANSLTYADVNFDETGLYVTYADSEGVLLISKLNPISLEVTKTWSTGKQKQTIANLFFVCGRMYTTGSANTRHLTGHQWGFDTSLGKEFFFEYNVESKYGSVTQLSYNPREKAIMGWDNQHAVVWPVYY